MRTLLDSALDEQQQTSERSLTAAFHAAVQGDPNTAGRAVSIARKLGLNPEQLTDADQLKIAERITAENELLSFYSQNPRLDRVLRDLPTLRMLRDDTGNLKFIGDTFDWWRRSYETGAAINEGGYLKAQGAFRDLTEPERKRLAELHDIEALSVGETGVFPMFAQLVGQQVQPLIGATGIGGAAAGIAALFNPAAAGAAFAWAAGSTWFAHSAAVEFGHEYETIHDGLRDALIAKGVAPDEAGRQAAGIARLTAGGYALTAASLEVFAEALLAKPFVGAAKALTRAGEAGIPQITRAAARTRLLRETAAGLLGESVTEGVQELASSAAENIAGSMSGTDFGPTAGEAVGRAGDVMWQMAQGMLVLAPIGPILHYNLDSGRVEAAQRARKVFDGIAKAAQDSQVRTRDAETFAEVVAAQAQDSGASNVYIEGGKLAAALEQAGISREQFKTSLPDAARQLTESEAVGGDSDVVIPMGTFAAHVAGSELYQHVADHVRLDKDGFSRAQADEWLKERDKLREEATTNVQRSKAEISDWTQQLDAVEQRIAGEVAASPKLEKSDAGLVAKLHRHFVEVNAARLHMTPAQFDEKYRLAFQFSEQTPAPAFEQTTSPAFRAWFGDSKIVDKRGRPLVVWHGTPETVREPDTTTGRDPAKLAVAQERLRAIADKVGLPASRIADVAHVARNLQATGQLAEHGLTEADVAEAQAAHAEMRAAQGTVVRGKDRLGFTVFDLPGGTKELGAHFGTKEQTRSFGTAFPFYLALRNPLRLPDLGTWDYQLVMREARKAGVPISEDEYTQVFNAPDNNTALRELLLSKGIDGVVYSNEAEGKGDSYIAFRPEQIKSVDNRGTFDPNDPNILRQDSPADLFVQHNLTAENLAHADELGGLPAPSLGIARQTAPLEGFGDITLIGPPDMVDPQTGAATFAGDAFTSRFPEVAHERVPQREFDAWFTNLEQSVGQVPPSINDVNVSGAHYNLNAFARAGNRSGFVDALTESTVGELAFLRAAGWTGEIPSEPIPLRGVVASDPTFQEWVRAHFEVVAKALEVRGEEERRASAELRDVTAQVVAAYRRLYEHETGKVFDAFRALGAKALGLDGLVTFSELDKIAGDLRSLTSGKTQLDISALNQLVRDHGGREALKAWAKEAAHPLFRNPQVRLRGRLVPATLENLVEAMVGSGRVRGREKGMTHGPGAAKARVIKQFRKMSDIQKARPKIAPSDAHYASAIKHATALGETFREAAIRNSTARDRSTWDTLDDSMRALGDLAKLARPSAERTAQVLRAYRIDPKPGVVEMAQKAAKALREAPVEYFESKPQRAVLLSEFKAAVVPEKAPAGVFEILAKHGIPVTTYTPGAREASIDAALKSQQGLLFQATPTYFFSALRNAVAAVPHESLTRDSWRQVIRGLIAKGMVKEREVFWTGLDEFLAGDSDVKLDKRLVVDYLDRGGVTVGVVAPGDGRRVYQVVDSDGSVVAEYDFEDRAQTRADELDAESRTEFFRDANRVVEHEMAVWRVTKNGVGTSISFRERELGDDAESEARETLEALQETASENAVPGDFAYYDLKETSESVYKLEGPSVDEDEVFTSWEEAVSALDAAEETSYYHDSGAPSYAVVEKSVGEFGEYVVDGTHSDYGEVALTWTSQPEQVFDADEVGHGFGDDAADVNRLAHFRYTVRKDAAGKEILFVEEVQSDYADAVREKGINTFATEDARLTAREELRQEFLRFQTRQDKVIRRVPEATSEEAFADLAAELEQANAELFQAKRRLAAADTKMAAAPFVHSTDAWATLTLKAILTRAALNGFDTVAFATGYQTANVYGGLSTVLERAAWAKAELAPETTGAGLDLVGATILELSLVDYSGAPVRFELREGVTTEGVFLGGGYIPPFTPIAKVVGKSLADLILAKPAGNYQPSESLDLGGLSGMLSFYGDENGYSRAQDLTVRTDSAGKPILAILPKLVRDLTKNLPGAEFTTTVMGRGAVSARTLTAASQQIAVKLSPDAISKIREGFPLFQPTRGAFDPQTGTAFLHRAHDASTFLHEMSHYWLTTLLRAASDPQADTSVREDAQVLLDWFGVKDIDAWNAMSLEQQREHHESFAYTSEIYLHENKTPANNAPLRRMFRAFAQWLRRVYRDIRTTLNETYRQQFGKDLPALTPEVRNVYDRLLASEDAILAQEASRGLEPLFRERPAGMPDADWQAYERVREDAHNAAVDKLTADSLRQMRWLRNAKGRVLRELQKETRAARARIEGEERVAAEHAPVNVARRALLKGESLEPDGSIAPAHVPKINLEDARRLLAERGIEGGIGALLRGMTAEDGASADVLAEMFGFDSGSDLVHALATAPSLEEDVQTRTDQRMSREHGDLTDPAQVTERVEKALHNQARTKMVAAELRFLANVTSPIQLMVRAARTVAREIVGNERAGEVSPRDHALAEIRARKDADKLRKKGDTAGAAKAKRRELLESQAVREAIEARGEIDALRKLVSKMFRPEEKLATTRNTDYVNAGRSLAAAFGLQPGEVSAVQFVEALRAYNPQLFEQLAPVFERAKSWEEEARRQGRDVKTWKDLTVDEFRELHDAIRALWNLSRSERQFELEGERRELDAVAEELGTQARETAGKIPDPVKGARTDAEKRSGIWNRLWQLAARIEHWAYRMDAGAFGVFTKYLWRPIRSAVDAFVVDQTIYTKRVAQLVRDITPKLKRGVIEFRGSDGEVIYTFGRGNGGFGAMELVGALLHTGNESNLRKLLLGREWGTVDEETGDLDTTQWATFVAKMQQQGYITKDVMDFVQAVWNLNEELKPLAQKAHRKLYGYYFREVEASPVATPWGTYRGGYMPAKVDADARSAPRIRSLEELERDFRKQFASTGRGFTRTRVENFAEPLSLDLNLVPAHVDDVLRFAHLQPVVHQAERLLKHSAVATVLQASQPGVWNNMLLPWLQRVASQSATKAGMSRDVDGFWRAVRKSVGMSMMFANVSNALQQFTGGFLAALRVRPKYLLRGLWTLLSERSSELADIAQLSPFMAHRQDGQIFDSVEAVRSLAQNEPAWKTARGWISRHAYFLQTAFQNAVDAVVWRGAYEQAIEAAGSEQSDDTVRAEAIAQADAAVRMTQSSFDPTDVANYEEGTPFYKLFTQFSGYFNTVANLHADEFQRIARAAGFEKAGRAFMLYLFGFAVPMLLADAITRTLRGTWDDEDKDGSVDVFTLDFLFLGQIRNALAEVPLAGPLLGNPLLGAFDNKPWNDRMLSSPAVSLLERAGGGTLRTIQDVVAGKPLAGRDVRDVMTALGLLFGLPGGAVGSRAGYLVDVASGAVQPSGPADVGRALLGGASK